MQQTLSRQTIFTTPFSRAYWKAAFLELGNVRMLILAALITALRIAVKSLDIPLAPNLNLTFGFFFNAAGSMIYGPVMGLLTGALSDTIGALFFPSGPYFFPYIFTEMMGSLLFALFFYRTKITPAKIILARFTVTVVCNFMMDRLIMYWQNAILLGKPFKILSVPQIVKNLVLFPAQSVLLILFLGALIPVLQRFQLIPKGTAALKVQKKDIVLIVVLTIVAAAAILFYTGVWLPYRASLK